MSIGYLNIIAVVLLLECPPSSTDENVYGRVGQTVHMPCDLDTSQADLVEWFDLVHNPTPEPILIYASSGKTAGKNNEHPNVDNFKIDVSDNYALNISHLQMDDSGNYYCRVNSNKGNQKSYYLGVVGMLNCTGASYNLHEKDLLDLQCMFPYSGTQPEMRWVRSDGQVIKGRDDSDIQFTHNVVQNAASADDDGQTYTCHVSYGDMSQQCPLRPLSVIYSVRNISIEPSKSTYDIGDVLQCRARGNPEPQVIITEPRSEDGGSSNSLRIGEDWAGKVMSITCQAQNTVNGKQTSISYTASINVSVKKETVPTPAPTAVPTAMPEQPAAATAGSSSTVVIVGIIIGIVVVLCIIACCCIRKRKQAKKKGTKLPTTEQEADAKMSSSRV